MFNHESIMRRTRRQPFEPFRIVTTTGQTYDVMHPDSAAAGPRGVMIVLYRPDGRPDRYSEIAYIHITELQDLPAPVAAAPDDAE